MMPFVRSPTAHRCISILLLACAILFAACDSGGQGAGGSDDGGLECSFPIEFLNEGANRGAITPVNNPSLVRASTAEEELPALSNTSRVLGLLPSFHDAYGGTPLAVPLDVLFDSEVMNLDTWSSRPLAITFCPLTSSTLVFDREAIGGARFEVSGLLLNNGNEDHPGNLVMVDAQSGESLWPQMSLGAVCGPDRGTSLRTLPAVEMRWGRWKELHPSTRVALKDTSEAARTMQDTGPSTAHTEHSARTTDEVPLGRVLGIPDRARVGGGTGGLALSFQDLAGESPVRAVSVTVSRESMVVFWSADARAAMAYKTSSAFSVRDGNIIDDRTQSTWSVTGRAIGGPRTGDQLPPVDRAYISDGRAWFDFQPDTRLWRKDQ